jgi:hypothetical protein
MKSDLRSLTLFLFILVLGGVAVLVGKGWLAAFIHHFPTAQQRSEIVTFREKYWEERKRKGHPSIKDRADKDHEHGPIWCHLEWASDSDEINSDKIRVKIGNAGDKPFRFWACDFGMRDHFTMLVRNSDGKIVSDRCWIEYSSRQWPPKSEALVPVQELKAGEMYDERFSAHILMPTSEELLPGRYSLQVIFAYEDLGGFPEPNQDFFARSEKLTVQIGPRGEFLRDE